MITVTAAPVTTNHLAGPVIAGRFARAAAGAGTGAGAGAGA